MADRTATLLLDTPVVRVGDVVCRATRAPGTEDEVAREGQVILPRRGVFSVRSRRRRVTVDATTAVVLDAGDEYRVDHPAEGGDECIVLLLPGDVLDQALGHRAALYTLVRPGTQFAAAVLRRALASGADDVLEAEEWCLALLRHVACDFSGFAPKSGAPTRRHQIERVEDVRALLAGSPTEPWQLAQVAAAVHCSPYHLARQFREITGESMARYLLRVRLAIALQRLSEGEESLARLAADCGFTHHSHFTLRFRTIFGLTPAAARAELTRTRLRDLRTIVTAEPREAP